MKLNLENCGFKQNEIFSRDYQRKISEITKTLHSPDHSAGTTWVDWPIVYEQKEFARVQKLAKQITSTASALLVVGIGGSYLGAKAGIDMLAQNGKFEVIFAGINFDYTDLSQKLDQLRDREIYVNVVSKSGTTVEILSTFNIVERFLKNKYKTEYKSHLIITTDKVKGYLRQFANQNGIETLTVPDSMGGRYSVLSSVGMLPFACAGINVKKIMEGAADAFNDLSTDDVEKNIAYQYAIYRNIVYRKLDKRLELVASFNSKLSAFAAWLQQLYSESEGKDGKGMFVTPLAFSTDLHSVGQFIQQGSPIMTETILKVASPAKDIALTNIPLDSPIKFLDGKTMSQINTAAENGTIQAHKDAEVPIAVVEIDEINEYNFGYMVYFFELACAASGYLLGINPFNQPGVEQYKSYMRELLKK